MVRGGGRDKFHHWGSGMEIKLKFNGIGESGDQVPVTIGGDLIQPLSVSFLPGK
jgi:hypothetical protein